MNCTIDEKIYQEFRKALNATNVFGCEKEYVELYNLGYALWIEWKSASVISMHIR